MVRRVAVAVLSVVLAATAGVLARQSAAIDLRGAWLADVYLLKDGPRHPVRGHIFFTDRDWTVLFFVAPDGRTPARGSGEGGTYTLDGDRLVLAHHYNLSAGNAVAGLPESPLTMKVTDPAAAATEPCRVEVDGDRLTLFFPSGNSMTFRRSSRF